MSRINDALEMNEWAASQSILLIDYVFVLSTLLDLYILLIEIAFVISVNQKSEWVR